VSGRTEFFLGIIALATLAMAIAQVGVMVAAGLAARRMARLADNVEREIRPLVGHLNDLGGHLNDIGRDASRAAALATTQVERVDLMFGDLAGRLDQALNGLQSTIQMPAREGRAILSGFRAAVQAIREIRENGRARQGRGDDEDALFI
jgi:hypothetical protein